MAGTVSPTQRLAELGLALPAVPTPLASYVPAAAGGGMIFTAGQLPLVDGTLVCTGIVGAEVEQDQAVQAARTAALNAVAAAAAEAGGLDEIARVVRLTVFVASALTFTAQSAVANGASDLIGELFGDAGRHARSAVGVAVLPLNAPVEVELVALARARARIVDV